jgi:hypothetical protein
MGAEPMSRLRFEASRLVALLYLAGWIAGLVWAIGAAHGLFWDVVLSLGFGLLAWPLSIRELVQGYAGYLAERRPTSE